jgi:hypothetical protein
MKITLPIAAFAAVLALTSTTVSAQTTTATGTTTPASTTKTKAATTKYGGTLTAIDPSGASITITDKTKSPRTILLTPSTQYKKDKKPATLADFKVGDKVGGSYTTDATGKMTATTLNTNTAKTAAAKAKTTATGTTTPAAPATPAAQ